MSFKKGNPSDWIRRVVKPGDVVIDGGANVGGFARAAAETVGPTGLVYAVEPDPRCHDALQALADQFAQVRPVLKALDSWNGLTNLFQGVKPEHSSLFQAAVADQSGEVAVPCTMLGSLHRGKVDAIKLDLQGGEPAALIGGANLLMQQPCPLWCVELWPWAQNLSGTNRIDFILWLFAGHEYKVYGLDPEGPALNYYDLLAWSREKLEPTAHINVVFKHG